MSVTVTNEREERQSHVEGDTATHKGAHTHTHKHNALWEMCELSWLEISSPTDTMNGLHCI